MGTSHRKDDQRVMALRFEAERTARERSREIIEAWNADLAAGRVVMFSPTIATALAADCPWLQAYCPGCQTIGEVDLAAIDSHPDATIESLIPALSCKTCLGNAPFAKLKGLARESQAPGWRSQSFTGSRRE